MKNELTKFCIFSLLLFVSFFAIIFTAHGSQEKYKILNVPKLEQVGKGCAPTSLDMVLHYFGTNSDDYNYRNMFPSNSVGHLSKELIDVAQSRDMLVRQKNNGSLDDLVKFIDNGIPVLVMGVYKGTELKDFINLEELKKFLSDNGENSDLLNFKQYFENNNIKSMHWMVVVGYRRDNNGKISDIYFNNPNSSHTEAEYYSASDFQNEFWNKNVIPGASNYFLVMAKNNTSEALTINKLLPNDDISDSLKNTLDLLNNFHNVYYNLENPRYNEIMAQVKGALAPIYVDKDMLIFNVESNEKKKGYDLSADYELMGGADWIVYVIKLKPEDMKSKAELNKKAGDNRTVFLSEATDIETIFVPAKSAWKWLDITSVIVDLAFSAVIDQTNSVVLPKDEEAVYLIRAYSGGFGLQDDKEERQFVIDNVDLGKSRQDNALIVNVISGAMDVVSLLISFADMDSSNSSNGELFSEVVGMIQKDLLLLDTKEEMTADDLLIMINDVADYIATEYVSNMIEEESKNAVIRAGKFLSESADKALGTVNVVKKISKGGQIANRAFTLIYTATPLETAYIVNKELPEGEKTVGWKTYKNKKYGFEIKYQEGWEIKSSDDLMYSYYDYELRLYNTEVDRKAKEAQEKFGGSEWSPYLNGIDISVVKKEKSLEQFIEANYNNDLTGESYGMGGSKFISKTNITLPNGMQAVDVVCEGYGMCGATLLESDTHIYNISSYCSNGSKSEILPAHMQGMDYYEFNTEKDCDQILETFNFIEEKSLP